MGEAFKVIVDGTSSISLAPNRLIYVVIGLNDADNRAIKAESEANYQQLCYTS